MKIVDITVVSKGLPNRVPALVRVDTDEGVTGVGATAAATPVIASIIENDRDGLKDLLIGSDATNPNEAWRLMFASGLRGRSGEGGVAVNAMGAIDMALWDIAGKAAGLPVYKMRGGAVQDRVMVYASATAFDRALTESTGEMLHKPTDALVAEARENKACGFKAMKFGWGNWFSEKSYDDLYAIREAIGPDMKLMLDFGSPAYLDGSWTVKQAIQVAERLLEYDIFFWEEALHPYDVDGFEVVDGRLVGTSGELPVLHAVRPDDLLDENDLLQAVEITMQVSAGSQVGITFNGGRQLNEERVLRNLRNAPEPPLHTELEPGDEFHTYRLENPGRSFSVGGLRNILVQPTDAADATFAIESVRLIMRKEHLRSIASGPGWHGLGEI